MNCYACGAPMRDGARFCTVCGKEQRPQPAPTQCVYCGQPVFPGAKFCRYCGSDQNAPSQTPPVEEPVVTQTPQTPAAAEPYTAASAPTELLTPEKLPVSPVVTAAPVAPEAPVVPETPAAPVTPVVPVTPVMPVTPVAPVEPQPDFDEDPFHSGPLLPPEPQPVADPVPPPVQETRFTPYSPQPPVIVPPAVTTRPARQLSNKRGLLKMILLGLLTLGIYPIVIWCKISSEINVVASRYDGKWTMHYWSMTILAPLTLMIYPFVWIHGLCNRIGDELIRRKIDYKFDASTFWIWNLLYPIGCSVLAGLLFLLLPRMGVSYMVLYLSVGGAGLLSLIGPFIYLHKHMKAMNKINTDYNEKG